jgi:mitochondrial import inner membrane translocase subunit TIM10
MFSQQPSQQLLEAELNLELFTNFTQAATNTCFLKCVSKEYKMDQLSKAEQVCSDRCIAKFFESNRIIQELAMNELLKRST